VFQSSLTAKCDDGVVKRYATNNLTYTDKKRRKSNYTEINGRILKAKNLKKVKL